jgi:tyrosinase
MLSKIFRPIVTNAFEYNPRCITRDFRPQTLQWSNTYANITAVLDQTNFDDFDTQFEGVVNNPHGAGHTGIGGTNTELFSGNGDPSFYLHHAAVDHLWTVWQGQDLANRTYVVTKTLTIRNSKAHFLNSCPRHWKLRLKY